MPFPADVYATLGAGARLMPCAATIADEDSTTPAQAYDDRPTKGAGAYDIPDKPPSGAELSPGLSAAAARRLINKPPPLKRGAGRGGGRGCPAAAADQAIGQSDDGAALAGVPSSAVLGSGRAGGNGAPPPDAPQGWPAVPQEVGDPDELPGGEAHLAEPLLPSLGDYTVRWAARAAQEYSSAGVGVCLRSGFMPPC